jgi:hypothetical protein
MASEPALSYKQPCKGALLISGEPGTGKSRWIREESVAKRAKLFRWNVRIDRSLREGREVLHQQVRSKDRLFVWIEGADDLTQEAQAFLRRILETASPNVTCCLEVREVWKLSPPILSRCKILTMRSDMSYRLNKNTSIAARYGLTQPSTPYIPTWNEIPNCRKRGDDPYVILNAIIEKYTIHDEAVQECIRAIGSGSSPWIQLTKFIILKCVRLE